MIKMRRARGNKERLSRLGWLKDILIRRELNLGHLLLGAGLIAALTFLIYPNLYIPAKDLEVGDISPKDIRARSSFLVEDEKFTSVKRDEARERVLSVYDYDPNLAGEMIARIEEAFDEAFAAHEEGIPPLSSEKGVADADASADADTEPGRGESGRVEEVETNPFASLGIDLSRGADDVLMSAGSDLSLKDNVILPLSSVMGNWVASSRELLDADRGKGLVVRELGTGKERVLRDLSSILVLDEARDSLERRVRSLARDWPEPVAESLRELAGKALRPNLVFNKKETDARRDAAVAAVKPIYYRVKEGEMIVRQGEQMTEDQLVKLRGMHYFDRKTGALRGVGVLMAVSLLMALCGLYIFKFKPTLRRDLQQLTLLSLIIIGNVLAIKLSFFIAHAVSNQQNIISIEVLLYAIPLSLGAIMVSILFDLDMVILSTAATVCLVALLMKEALIYPILVFVGGMVASYKINLYRRRTSILSVGILIGAANMFIISAMDLITGGVRIFDMAMHASAGFTGGLLAGLVATGLLPITEGLFKLASDIRLLELSDPNNPVLRELMVRAPGTYHHSVIVGRLAEEAAETVNVNPLFARVSSYYHDIGKLVKPEYFIENQIGIMNKHDNLSPSMSSLIIMAHVKEGLDLAKEFGLGRAIIDIIQQHHGTSLVYYFYNKARGSGLLELQDVAEEPFRYPGPKPQTKEAAIVMLADAVEAASKSLNDPTPARVQGLVQRMVNNIFIDGQLDECDLTLKDLNKISTSFIRVLNGMFHRRVDYPERNGNSKQLKLKEINGGSDQESAKKEDRLQKDEKLG